MVAEKRPQPSQIKKIITAEIGNGIHFAGADVFRRKNNRIAAAVTLDGIAAQAAPNNVVTFTADNGIVAGRTFDGNNGLMNAVGCGLDFLQSV